jgi:hypothetical protein
MPQNAVESWQASGGSGWSAGHAALIPVMQAHVLAAAR